MDTDTVVNVYASDLEPNGVTSPVWSPVDGMARVTDDALHIASGSAPLVGGRAGFGTRLGVGGVHALFDHLQLSQQA
ncbi:MAG TPA: hypothetical protein VFS67_07585 [Polyangiaceae bacterium]|nr:hypothetical protein [Polyangiaceae bacterium]